MSMDNKIQRELEVFFSKYKVTKFNKGELILKPGDSVGYIGQIKKGYVRMYTINEYGEEITTPFFKPILYFTAIMAMTNMKNRFYFEALTETEVQMAPKDEALKFFESNQEVSRDIMGTVSTNFMDIVEKMGMLLSGNAYNKVAVTLEALVDKVDFAITHKLIASLTGLTRETVTLQLLKMEKSGIISKNKRKMIINDKQKLNKAIRSKE